MERNIHTDLRWTRWIMKSVSSSQLFLFAKFTIKCIAHISFVGFAYLIAKIIVNIFVSLHFVSRHMSCIQSVCWESSISIESKLDLNWRRWERRQRNPWTLFANAKPFFIHFYIHISQFSAFFALLAHENNKFDGI